MPTPDWNLTSTHVPITLYSFSGYRNGSLNDESFLLHFNYSQCTSTSLAEYGASVIDPPFKSTTSNLEITEFTKVSGQFDNNSASFQIRGIARAGANKNIVGEATQLAGPITITFMGTLDGDRSDNLLPNTNGTPIWESTLGYNKSMYGEEIGEKNAGGRAALDIRVYALCLFGALLWLL